MSASPLEDSPVRVLVIEDNADDCELLMRQLKKSRMESHVKFIDNGKDALDLLVNPPSSTFVQALIAIFLDLKLPSLGGLELLRRIRAMDRFKNLPVIVMTSSDDPKDMEECRRLKVVSYVPKPVSFTTFSKAVADVFHLPKLGTKALPPKEY